MVESHAIVAESSTGEELLSQQFWVLTDF